MKTSKEWVSGFAEENDARHGGPCWPGTVHLEQLMRMVQADALRYAAVLEKEWAENCYGWMKDAEADKFVGFDKAMVHLDWASKELSKLADELDGPGD